MTGELAVRRLRLSHFRSHKSTELETDGRPVAIYGANGSGKTNLLEALSLLSPGRGLRGAGSAELSRTPEKIGWKVAAEIDGFGGRREVETWANNSGRLVRLDGKAVAQTDLGGVLKVLWLVPSMDRLWTDAPAGRRRFLDRLTLSLMPGHAAVSIGYDKALRERNRLLRDREGNSAWYDAIEAQMAEFGAKVSANRFAALARLGETPASGAFPAARLFLDTEAPWTEAGLAEALARGRVRDQAAGRSLSGPHRDELGAIYAEKDMAASQCSTGEQKALLINVILANARAVAADDGAPPVLLLDEVAAHLDEGRRARLFDAVCQLGAQAWMTGTGAELFASLGERAQWLEVRERDGVSEVTAP